MVSYYHGLFYVSYQNIHSRFSPSNDDYSSILTGIPAGSYGSGNEYMAKQFHIQNQPFPNLYWATASWNVGAALFPLVFVPLTENTGRMPGYFVSRLYRFERA